MLNYVRTWTYSLYGGESCLPISDKGSVSENEDDFSESSTDDGLNGPSRAVRDMNDVSPDSAHVKSMDFEDVESVMWRKVLFEYSF